MCGANSEQKMLQMFYWETLQNPVIDLSSPNYRTINQKIDFLPLWSFLTLPLLANIFQVSVHNSSRLHRTQRPGVSILSFYCRDVLRQPLWNHHEHQYRDAPWWSSGDNRLSDISYEYHLADHKNCHISTFISQHGPLTADNVSPRTDKLSDSEKFTFYLRYFFPCSELHYSQGVRSVIVNILMWRVQISAMSIYIAELLQSIIIL